MRERRRSPLGLAWKTILPVVGGAVLAVGLGSLVCMFVAIGYGDGGTRAFGVTAAVTVPLGLLGLWAGRRLAEATLRARDTFFAVTMAWLAAAAFGALPMRIYGTFGRNADAFFESMSGFTTTGATLLSSIESQPHAILLWRSMAQWMGGVGIVVLFVAVAPAIGMASQRVFYAETSGPTSERLTPRIADTAKILWGIYLGLTIAGGLAFWAAGMGPFDAVNHIFTTVATGGFSTKDASMGAFDSVSIEVVAMVFMAVAGANFGVYWRLLRGESTLLPQWAELKTYFGIMLIAGVAVSLSLFLTDDLVGLWSSVRHGFFQVVSIMTSSGFITQDFDRWNDFARSALLLLMFVGGCAGSTAGGMKVVRVMLLAKSALQEVQGQLDPSQMTVLRVGGKVFSEDVRRAVLAFFAIYMAVFAAGTLAMTMAGLDLETATSAVVATLNIIGPGLGDVGASENFTAVPVTGRWILSALMLIGRLELFTVLVLFLPRFWNRGWA